MLSDGCACWHFACGSPCPRQVRLGPVPLGGYGWTPGPTLRAAPLRACGLPARLALPGRASALSQRSRAPAIRVRRLYRNSNPGSQYASCKSYGANGTRSLRAAALYRQLAACLVAQGFRRCKATNSENTAVTRVSRCHARPASQQPNRARILKSGQFERTKAWSKPLTNPARSA